MKKKLPIGGYSLDNMIAEGYLYIDKTEIVHRLITNNNRYFFSRPRRFGKSLLVSTLKEIFSGNKDLFKDLWIGQGERHTWHKYPVVVIDFSTIANKSPEVLERGIAAELDIIGKHYGIELLTATEITEKTKLLVRSLSEQHNKVVILIDEYEYAIIKHLDNPELAEKNREIIRTFYTCLKGLDPYIHFLFLTGVTRFAKSSIFSGLNNLQDISLNTDVAALCGYTEEEIHANLSEYVEEFAQSQECAPQVIWDEMRTWYNGYRFSKSGIKVYNPFSIFSYLQNKDLRNYWFATGTPKFLVDIIKRDLNSFFNISLQNLEASTLDLSDIRTMSLPTLLYQTGYLTLASYESDLMAYTMAYPNEEVRRSFNQCLIAGFLDVQLSDSNPIFVELRRALYALDINTFCKHLQSLLAQIPFHIQNTHADEAYYHSIFLVAGMAIGFAQAEVATNNGRIDLLLRTASGIFIFEFKCNKTAQQALKQIKDRGYATGYTAENKKVFAVGVNVNVPGNEFTTAWEQV